MSGDRPSEAIRDGHVELPQWEKCTRHYDRPCNVCGLKLARGMRKVHPGACARRRKTTLQRLRRHRG